MLLALLGVATLYIAADTLVKNPPTLPSISSPKIETKPKVETKDNAKDMAPAIPKEKGRNKNQAHFPVDPFTFHPKGLIRYVYAGSYNGRIIKWVEPLSVAIFEWNEDFENGAHYHVMKVERDWETYRSTALSSRRACPGPWIQYILEGNMKIDATK